MILAGVPETADFDGFPPRFTVVAMIVFLSGQKKYEAEKVTLA
jgi:hypothetical protein